MASGLLKAGVDLDSLFRARSTTKRADVGYQVGGVDISNRYEKRAGTAAANTGFASAGTDLAQLFESAIPVTTSYTLIAQISGNTVGYFLSGQGSLTPLQTFGGYQVIQIRDTISPSELVVGLNTTGLAQSFFTSITINGVTKTTASASSFDGSTWRWSGGAGLVNSVSYPMTITV